MIPHINPNPYNEIYLESAKQFKRDEFALKAMHAIITYGGYGAYDGESNDLATTSYEIADAMMKARENGTA